MTDRATARLVGILFILATVASTSAVITLDPILGDADYLTRASVDEGQTATGALLEIINHLAVVGIERELAAEDLVAIPLSDPDIETDRLMVIHERRREPNPAVASFIDFLVAQLNDRKLRTIWSKHAVCRRN